MKKIFLLEEKKFYYRDETDGVKIRYIYDTLGIAGVKYYNANGVVTDYEYVKDGQKDIEKYIKSHLWIFKSYCNL